MVLEIFESLFLVGSGFIPKSHVMQMSCNDMKEDEEVKEIESRSIKTETIILMRYLLGLRNKEKK